MVNCGIVQYTLPYSSSLVIVRLATLYVHPALPLSEGSKFAFAGNSTVTLVFLLSAPAVHPFTLITPVVVPIVVPGAGHVVLVEFTFIVLL